MGSLDLSALDDDTPSSDGKALRAPLNMFIPDDKQLNRERDEEADNRDREDIRMRGVMQPIVASTPGPDGRMHIRLGHRRWRLSGEAGIPDVPYVHEVEGVVYDEYAKLAENRKRKNESPMDIAELIVERKAAGEKNKYIADQIGIDPSEITHHLVLIEGPAYIRALYTEKKCRTPKYLYELTNLAKEFARQVEEFCADSDDFSYKAIRAFGDSLKNLGNTKEIPASNTSTSSTAGPAQPPAPAPGPDDESDTSTDPAEATKNPATGGDDDKVVWPFPTTSSALESGNTNSAHDGGDNEGGNDQVVPSHIPSHNPDNEKDAAAPYLADPSKIKKPLLLGTYKGSDVMVMLNKRPTTPGLIFVKHENGTGEEEVEFGKVKNLTLTEAQLTEPKAK